MTCTLTLQLSDGAHREWTIGAVLGVDNEHTLRAHVARWVPGAQLLSVRWQNDTDNALERARDLAHLVHHGQGYAGADYFTEHLSTVAANVAPLGEHAQIVAHLHDTLEDSDLTAEQLQEWFGAEIAADVTALTRRAGETYAAYIERLVQANSMIRAVKRADLECHLAHAATLKPTHAQRYRRALARLRDTQ